MIKLKDILTEAKNLDQKYLDKIHKMTQANNHLAARVYLSLLIEGHKKGNFYKYWNAASEINVVFGHTPPELSKLNQKMEKRLYKEIKKRFANSAEIIGLL